MSNGHAFYGPSKADMWMQCHGALAQPKNQRGGGNSKFADDGTASHTWASRALVAHVDAEAYLGEIQTLEHGEFTMDEDRAGYVQMYLDDVRMRALGGYLLVEHWVDLSQYLGEGQGGTGDACIAQVRDRLLIVEDLKYGQGHQVFASYTDALGKRRPNRQLGLYAVGFLRDAELLSEFDTVRLVVCQPRLGHIDEADFTLVELLELAAEAENAVAENGKALALAPGDPDLELYLNPSESACRWCLDKAECTKLAKVVAEEVRMDFETVAADPPVAPRDTKALTLAMNAVPLVELWCKAVRFEVDRLVREGAEVIGSDGQPYKIVEGKLGKNQWIDEKVAEGALAGRLPPEKMYQPQKIITAPAAKKLLGNTKAKLPAWNEAFAENVHRAPGKPLLVLGSDPRPAYSGAADAEDFDEIEAE